MAVPGRAWKGLDGKPNSSDETGAEKTEAETEAAMRGGTVAKSKPTPELWALLPPSLL
jgi:hypothetical protein